MDADGHHRTQKAPSRSAGGAHTCPQPDTAAPGSPGPAQVGAGAPGWLAMCATTVGLAGLVSLTWTPALPQAPPSTKPANGDWSSRSLARVF